MSSYSFNTGVLAAQIDRRGEIPSAMARKKPLGNIRRKFNQKWVKAP